MEEIKMQPKHMVQIQKQVYAPMQNSNEMLPVQPAVVVQDAKIATIEPEDIDDVYEVGNMQQVPNQLPSNARGQPNLLSRNAQNQGPQNQLMTIQSQNRSSNQEPEDIDRIEGIDYMSQQVLPNMDALPKAPSKNRMHTSRVLQQPFGSKSKIRY